MISASKALASVLTALLLGGSSLAAQQVGQTVTKRGTITQDLYLAGGTVEVNADVHGDVIAAGGRVLVAQRVTGDVMVAGGSVELAAEVLDDVRAAGGTVTLRGRVSGDAIATGGTIEVRPDATVGGRAWFSGGKVNVGGRIATHLKAAAEKIVISGVVENDVDLSAKEIEILASARISGTLTYRSPSEARVDPAAQVGGGITRLPYEPPSLAGRVAARLLFLAVTGVLGATLILFFPGFSMGVVRTLGREPWKSVGLGAGALVGGPVAAIVLMATVVGLALGVTLFVVYGLALAAGCLIGAFYIGDAVLALLRRAPATSVGESISALLLGLIALSLLALIPFVGSLARLATLLFGLGALVLAGYRSWRARRAEAQASAAVA